MVEISIIVPIYNCEKYLERCLESIRGQVFQNWEAILVDDGSTDRSGDICDLYADRDPRFSVIHQENKGASIARMEGARLSKGKYLGFVDSDDWISPEMYQRMYGEGRKHDADMVLLGTFICETENDMLKRRLVKVPAGLYDRERMEKEIFPDAISDGGFFTHGINCAMTNKLFRRECLMPYILYSEGAFIMAEDAAISFPVLFSSNRVYVCEDFDSYHAYAREGSVSRSYKNNFFETCKKWHAYMLDKCIPLWEGNLERQIDSYFVSLSITAFLNEYRHYSAISVREKYARLKAIASDEVFRNALGQIDRKKYREKYIIISLIKMHAYGLLHMFFLFKEAFRKKGVRMYI